MINNNMDMIKQMDDMFDYDEYVTRCKDKNLPIRDFQGFCMGIGTLMVGRNKYPNLDWQESYLKTFQEVNEQDKEDLNVYNAAADSGCCEDEKDEKPLGLIATGKNLIKSTKEHIAKGMSHVSPDEYLRRLTICRDCEWIKEGFQCGQCHCFMGIKAGWDIKDACKLNKW